MKKIYYLFCVILIVLAVSCTPEEEDLFNDSSANRANKAITANLDFLTGSSNGWLMEYFPSSMQEFGGYNVVLAFEKDGTVKAASEKLPNSAIKPTDIVTSLYSIKQSAGIILSFDSYNSIFHFFSDPSDPSGVGGKGEGMNGDYDFLILNSSADKIVLKGKKSGSIAVLTPMKEEWSAYLTKIVNAADAMNFKKYRLDMNGESISVNASNRTLIFSYEEGGTAKSQIASYIVTETGYKFYKPIVIKGTTISGFTFDSPNKWFTEVTNSAIKLIPIIPPLNEQFIAGSWYVAYSTAGAFAQPFFAYTANALASQGEELNFAYIGSAMYGKFGLNFSSGTDQYKGMLGLNYTLIGENQVTLKFNFTAQGNGAWYYNNAAFNYFLNPFGLSVARTFTLTTDNINNPTYITLTENTNATNAITLHKALVAFPFSN